MFAGVEQSMDGKQSRVGRGQEASRRVGRACAGDTVSVSAMLGGVVGPWPCARAGLATSGQLAIRDLSACC